MSLSHVFLNNSVLEENGSIDIIDKRGTSEYVVSKKQKVVLAVNLPKALLSTKTGKFSLDTLSGTSEISAMIQAINLALKSSVDRYSSFELFYLKKALEATTADVVDIIYTLDDDYEQLTANDIKGIVRYVFVNSMDFYGVVASAFKDGTNIFDVLDETYFEEKMSSKFLGYMIKIKFNPFTTEEAGLSVYNFNKLASFTGGIPGVVSPSDLKKYGFTPSPSLISDISLNAEKHSLISGDTFFGRTCDDAFYANVNKKKIRSASETSNVKDKVKDITVFMPSVLITKKELEVINFNSKNLNFSLLVDGKSAAQNSTGFNSSDFSSFAFAKEGLNLIKPWERLVMNVSDGQFIAIDDKAINIYASSVAKSLKADSFKNKYYENGNINLDLRVPGWDVSGRILTNEAKQPSMDAFMKDMIVDGSFNKVDMTDVVIGANFSYELGTTIRSLYEANAINSSDVKNSYSLLLSGALKRLLDNGILSAGSETDVNIQEYHGTFNIVVQAIDKDTNKKYSVTLDLTRTPSVDSLSKNAVGTVNLGGGHGE